MRPFVACIFSAALAIGPGACSSHDPLSAFAAGDYSTSLSLWIERARRGDHEAENYVAIHYHLGLGVGRDLPAAASWYRRAAEGGNADAQRNLGTLYQHGLGVPEDKVRAYAWYHAAVLSGHPRARVYIESMTNQLTANQIMKAKRIARTLVPEPADPKASG